MAAIWTMEGGSIPRSHVGLGANGQSLFRVRDLENARKYKCARQKLDDAASVDSSIASIGRRGADRDRERLFVATGALLSLQDLDERRFGPPINPKIPLMDGHISAAIRFRSLGLLNYCEAGYRRRNCGKPSSSKPELFSGPP